MYVYDSDLAYSETLPYTGTYFITTEDYGDGSNGTLTNIYLDGELIPGATIEDGPLEQEVTIVGTNMELLKSA